MMKLKMSIVGVMVLFGVMFSIPQSASSAETLWATVTIDRVYYHKDGWCTARLTEADPVNPVFDYKLFRAKTGDSKAILAVLLTAESLGRKVRIAFTDGDPAAEILMAGIENR